VPESEEQRLGRASDLEDVRIERARHVEDVAAERALEVALLARQRARRALTIALIGAAVSLAAMSFTLLLAIQVSRNTTRSRRNLQRIECLAGQLPHDRCPSGK
jgi:hypothetical protein